MLHTLLAQAADVPVAWYEEGWFKLVAVLAVLVVPYLLGASIARGLRMPDYGWKLGIILVALTSGVVIDLYGAFLRLRESGWVSTCKGASSWSTKSTATSCARATSAN